jgi:hypothetical protein
MDCTKHRESEIVLVESGGLIWKIHFLKYSGLLEACLMYYRLRSELHHAKGSNLTSNTKPRKACTEPASKREYRHIIDSSEESADIFTLGGTKRSKERNRAALVEPEGMPET